MELFDSHCHIDVADFDADRGDVLARTRAAGVGEMLVPAVEASTWDKLLALCRAEPGLYAALGLHPVYADQHHDEHLALLARHLKEHPPRAVGEIGLDYFVPGLDRARQQVLFEGQLRLAREAQLPVILHVRKSHDQILATLRRIRVVGGIAHAFNGSLQQAQQFIELGFKLGFGGTLTYDRALKIRALARALPLESLVLETDAPDIPLATHRGERNSPEYLPECLAALAAVRNEDPTLLAAATTRNARAVLKLNPG